MSYFLFLVSLSFPTSTPFHCRLPLSLL